MNRMKTVIIPTLNEAENIGILVPLIIKHLGQNDVQIFIVDDNSSDGTHKVVRNLQSKYSGVKLFIRTKERGLSSAIRYGAKHVIDGPIVVMDADLSHNPRYLNSILDQLAKGYDVVVGSRYIDGGGCEGWPGQRIAMSRFATMIGRLLLRIKIHDPMSGFVGVKSKEILTDGFSDADYKFLVEILARHRNLRVTEVPIVFRDRTYGKSKLGAKTILLYLALVMKLVIV
jgi:dolichol-phosphate mannosyltransferase